MQWVGLLYVNILTSLCCQLDQLIVQSNHTAWLFFVFDGRNVSAEDS